MRLPRRRPSGDARLVRVGTGRRRSAPMQVIGDGSRSLGEGPVLVEAGIVARLMGVRLLRLDARVLLTPASAAGTAHQDAGQRAQSAPARLSRVRETTDGSGLAEARALLAAAERAKAPGSR